MTAPAVPVGNDPLLAPEVLKAQSNTVRSLSGAAVFGGIAVAGAIPAGALLAASIADSDAAAGFAQTSGVLGAALLALPLARIALTRGRRAALSLGYAIGAVGAAIVVFAAIERNLLLVYLGCLLVGVASAAALQARYAATDLAAEQHRARALSLVVWASTIGAVLGPNLLNASGNLALALGLPQLSGPYLVSAACLAIAAAILWLFLRPDPYRMAMAIQKKSTGVVSRPSLREGLAHLRQRPRAMMGIAAISAGHICMVMVMVMTPVHMAHVDVTLQLIGLVISVHVAGMYAFSPVVGWAVDTYGRTQIVVVGIIILLFACLLCGVAPGDSIVMLGIGLLLLGLGWSCTLIAGSTIVTDEVDAEKRPAVQGLSDLAMNASGAVGGAVAGLVVLLSTYGVLCAVAAIPVLLLAMLVAVPKYRAPILAK
ncbi:MAG: MFS transporter [Actinomycetota bacterium]|nr:MFS transporter [Actinomycetota bacterium]MDP2288933.1 MFS transporter [Actinomycetota bacterium]